VWLAVLFHRRLKPSDALEYPFAAWLSIAEQAGAKSLGSGVAWAVPTIRRPVAPWEIGVGTAHPTRL
jgi:hypothetical protein